MKNIYIEGPTHLGISIFKKIEFYFLVLAFLTCSNTMLLFYMTHEKASESYFDESKGTYTLYQTAYRVLNKILGCSDKGTNDFVAIRFATDIALVGQLFSKVSFPNVNTASIEPPAR